MTIKMTNVQKNITSHDTSARASKHAGESKNSLSERLRGALNHALTKFSYDPSKHYMKGPGPKTIIKLGADNE
jgi:hypothetical protein